jgi:hypothetical protein
MRFQIYSGGSKYGDKTGVDAQAARLEDFLSFLTSTALPAPEFTREGRASATSGDISTFEMFTAFGKYRAVHGDAAYGFAGDKEPPTVVAREERDGLTFSCIPQIRHDGHSAHLDVSGPRGQVTIEFGVERDHIPSRGRAGDPRHRKFLYGKDAGLDPFYIEGREGLADRLHALWEAGDDAAFFNLLCELYASLTPQPGPMKDEHKRIVREVFAAVVAAGGARPHEDYPESVGLDPNNHKAPAGSVRLLLDHGFPETLSTPEGSYSLRNGYEIVWRDHDEPDPNADFDEGRFREILESSFDVNWVAPTGERERHYTVLEIRER